MSKLKIYQKQNVLSASEERIRFTFDNFEKVYISFSGGKDSSVMVHLVMAEAIRRNRKVAWLIVDHLNAFVHRRGNTVRIVVVGKY